MANKVFISFRMSDGGKIKENLVEKLKDWTINKSEEVDRRGMTDETIKRYLYEKLADSSLTIVLLTPNAINYETEEYTEKINDWLYDELRYSLENREGNKTNGVLAIYTEEAKSQLIDDSGETIKINNFNNLVRKNMFNIKSSYKKNPNQNIYDSDYDHYISLISLNSFLANPKKYIDIAIEKRSVIDHYEIKCRM